MKKDLFPICPICHDASGDCNCFPESDLDPRDNPLIGPDDDWIHDPDMGAR